MKELVLSLVISSLTIVTGYIVVKNTDVDILKYFQSKNNQPENSKKLKNTKKEMNDSLNNGKKDKDKIEATKKRISKTVKNFFQKIIKKDDNKKVQNRGTRKITAVASGKKGRLAKRGKKNQDPKPFGEKSNESKESKEEIIKKSKSKKEKKDALSVASSPITSNQEASSSSIIDTSASSDTSALKRKKINYIDLGPILTKVNDVVASETDLEDIEIDINDEKTNKDLDRNGEKITYSCSFESENREPGMLESGKCEEIGDANFYFDTDKGKLTWFLNESGPLISGSYDFVIEGSDGKNIDTVNFKITIEDGNPNEPENNTDSVDNSTIAGGNKINNQIDNN